MLCNFFIGSHAGELGKQGSTFFLLFVSLISIREITELLSRHLF